MAEFPERITDRIEDFGGPGCWLWTGWVDVDGYGYAKLDGRWSRIHRLAYVLFVGPIPEGLVIDHLCRVRNCVNPAHLEAVTVRENTIRGVSIVAANAAKTHCKNGHELSPENIYAGHLARWGERKCRICHVQNGRDWRAARKAARLAELESNNEGESHGNHEVSA